jgi:hypothetical protein
MRSLDHALSEPMTRAGETPVSLVNPASLVINLNASPESPESRATSPERTSGAAINLVSLVSLVSLVNLVINPKKRTTRSGDVAPPKSNRGASLLSLAHLAMMRLEEASLLRTNGAANPASLVISLNANIVLLVTMRLEEANLLRTSGAANLASLVISPNVNLAHLAMTLLAQALVAALAHLVKTAKAGDATPRVLARTTTDPLLLLLKSPLKSLLKTAGRLPVPRKRSKRCYWPLFLPHLVCS